MYRLGVDVGGTFTDVLADRRGDRQDAPDEGAVDARQDQSVGVIEGVTRVLATPRPARRTSASSCTARRWPPTPSSNARGARVGLVVTVGTGRSCTSPGRSCPAGWAAGSSGTGRPSWWRWRTSARSPGGSTSGATRSSRSTSRPSGPPSASSSTGRGRPRHRFLNSYANPAQELRAAEIAVEEAPGVPVSTSAGVLPELGEYERTLTTVANAYVRPGVGGLPAQPEHETGRRGARRRAPRAALRRRPDDLRAAPRTSRSSLLMSGPAGGVAAAVALGPAAGYRDLLTLDMGGTSTDVALIEDGTPAIRRETTVADLAVRAPSIDVQTVGAGGGSIAARARADRGAAGRPGQRRCGARPGDLRSRRRLPTVTDANVVLGYLPHALLGGADAARRREGPYRGRTVATRLGVSVEAAAAAIIDIVNEKMLGALRLVSVQRGYDPRRFRARRLRRRRAPCTPTRSARLLGSWPVVIPPSPGVLCAWGRLDGRAGRGEQVTRTPARRRRTRSSCGASSPTCPRRSTRSSTGRPCPRTPVQCGSRPTCATRPGFRGARSTRFDPERLRPTASRAVQRVRREHQRLFTFDLDGARDREIRAVGVSGAQRICRWRPSCPDGDGNPAQRPSKVYVDGRGRRRRSTSGAALSSRRRHPGPRDHRRDGCHQPDRSRLHRHSVDRLGNMLILPPRGRSGPMRAKIISRDEAAGASGGGRARGARHRRERAAQRTDSRWTLVLRTAMSPGIREQGTTSFPLIADRAGRMIVGQFGSYIAFLAGYRRHGRGGRRSSTRPIRTRAAAPSATATIGSSCCRSTRTAA